MRKRDALERALARAGRQPSRWMPALSRVRFRAHGVLLGMSGWVRLQYLTTPRTSAATRIDNRVTVRLLLSEARAARAASMHTYLVCMMVAREFAVRGVRAAQWLSSSRGRDAILRSPHRAASHVLRSPASAQVPASAPGRGLSLLRTIASWRMLRGTQWFSDELTKATARRRARSQRSGAITPLRPTLDVRTVFQRLVAGRADARGALPEMTRLAHAASRVTPRMHRTLRTRRVAVPVPRPVAQPIARSMSRPVERSVRHPVPHPIPRPVAPRPQTPYERATTRLSPAHPVGATADIAPVTVAAPRSYATASATPFSYRRARSTVMPDTKRQVQRQTSELQQQVVRQVTHELTQNTPWRGQLEQAVLAPRVLRELTERVAGAIAGRHSLERYRRGL